MNGKRDGGKRDAWRQVGRVSAFGLTTGVTMLLCGGLGLWLDRFLGTTPVVTVFLFLAGGATAFWYGVSRILKP